MGVPGGLGATQGTLPKRWGQGRLSAETCKASRTRVANGGTERTPPWETDRCEEGVTMRKTAVKLRVPV